MGLYDKNGEKVRGRALRLMCHNYVLQNLCVGVKAIRLHDCPLLYFFLLTINKYESRSSIPVMLNQ
jgi:hypothetical protein